MGTQSLMAPGCADVMDIGYGALTGHVLTERIDEKTEVQRWLLLSGPPAFRAPPGASLQLRSAVEGSEWRTTEVEEWLNLAREAWRPGCRFIKATFRAYSIAEYPSLPSDPTTSPGFPAAGQGRPAGLGAPHRALALPTQFDVGTSYFQLAEGIKTWVYRFGPQGSNPSYEYWVLHGAHAPEAYPTMTAQAANPENQYSSVEAFVAGMNETTWGSVAETFMLGTCYEVTSVDDLS